MFSNSFYHGTIRKYVIAFGSLFADIYVQRLDSSGNRVQTLGCPIAYGPKEKFLTRLRQDPNLDQDVAITLPRLGFEITSMVYAPERKLSSTLRNARMSSTDNDKLKTQYIPVPYDITFMLSVFVKNADDGAQIIEQIIPYFRPEFTVNVNLIPEMGIVADTPIVLTSLSMEDTYEGDFDTRRALIYNLDFILKGWFYGPTNNTGVIKRAITNLYQDTPADTPKSEIITVTPAQYANGAPLFSPSANAQLSVATSAIGANTDYGFSTDIDIDPFNVSNS